MSQPTYLQSLLDSQLLFVSSIVLEPIVKYFEENPEEEVTKEKLVEILNFPVPAAPAVVVPRTPPRGITSTKTQPLTTTAPKRTRRTTATTGRPQCKWFFTKGVNRDKQCTSSATDDSEYCSACKNKKGAGGSGRKAAAAVAGTPVPTKAPSRTTKSGLSTTKEVEAQPETYEIAVEEFGKSTDGFVLLLDAGSGFILKDIGDDAYTVVGIVDNQNEKTMRPLTPTEKAKAVKLLELEVEDGVELA